LKNRPIFSISGLCFAAAAVLALSAFAGQYARAEDKPAAAQTPATAAPSAPAATSPATPAAPATAEKPSDSPLPKMVIGDEKAPVTIVEYSSLSCPHCAAFHKEVFPKLKSTYIDAGKVRYEVREFPLNQPALAGAVVVRCLDPSRVFPFIDLLFSHQEEWAFKDDALTPLKQLAKQAGLPEEKFNKCLDDESLQKKILAVRTQGQKEGVNATPTIFINGAKSKAITFDAIAEAIKPYLGS